MELARFLRSRFSLEPFCAAGATDGSSRRRRSRWGRRGRKFRGEQTTKQQKHSNEQRKKQK
eukprot:COSAG06_NODE_18097_length_904_cov_1.094410_1_plen_60_part_01